MIVLVELVQRYAHVIVELVHAIAYLDQESEYVSVMLHAIVQQDRQEMHVHVIVEQEAIVSVRPETVNTIVHAIVKLVLLADVHVYQEQLCLYAIVILGTDLVIVYLEQVQFVHVILELDHVIVYLEQEMLHVPVMREPDHVIVYLEQA